MKVTQNLKDKLIEAKSLGYRRVFVTAGGFKATTYCLFYLIDNILAKPVGYDYGRAHPGCYKGMWTGHPNTRMVTNGDIQYTQLFRL